MPQASHKHHFIPAFYLKQWGGKDGLLIEWSRPHKTVVPTQRHPNATGFQRDLYTFEGLPPDSKQWFEDAFLKDTDKLASEALTRFLERRADTLNNTQRSGWVRFLMTLRYRHPDVLVEMRNLIATTWENRDAFTKDAYESSRAPTDPSTFDEYLTLMSPDAALRVQLDLLRAGMDNETVGTHILRMSWGVFDVLQLRTLEMLKTKSALRGDIVIFDEKILFADTNPELHPINSITTIEFKRPGRDDYTDTDNPLSQSFKLIDEIRSGEFQIRGRPVTLANANVPASIYCICDLTPTFRRVLKVQDAFVTPDNQGYYGFHRGFNAYYEIVDYAKMLRDAKNRNRIFFEKLNLVNNH